MELNKLKVVSIRLVDEPPLYSRKNMRNPSEVIVVMQEELNKYDRELFCILNLKAKGQVINLNIVSMGSLQQAIVHPREVFKSAILANASSIILLHNHPSGDCQPSEADIDVTKRLIGAGELLGIEVLDHIVIGEQKEYFSFKENEMLFRKDEMLQLVAEEKRDMAKSR